MQNKKNFPHDNKDMIAYAAGLFDGEGSIYFDKRPEKKKKHK